MDGRVFTPHVMRVLTRPTRRTSRNYYGNLRGPAQAMTRAALDFAACWHWHTKARLSEHLKELSTDKSVTGRAGHADSVTTQSLFQTVSTKRLANLRLQKKIS